MVRYCELLEESDEEDREAIKGEVLSYNGDDTLGTRALAVWLGGLWVARASIMK